MNPTKALFRLLLGRRLPTTEGRINVTGLKKQVTIGRDEYGIVYINADTADDAWYGLGFCHGQDRAFQMEFNVRVSRGTLAEAIGPAALPVDRLSRRIGFYRAAKEQLEVIGDDLRARLEAYVRGVNEGISKGADKLPPEFALLKITPTEYTPADVLAVVKLFSYSMSFNLDCELMRHKILMSDGIEALQALDHAFPEYRLALPPYTPIAGDCMNFLAEDLSRLQTAAGLKGGCNNWVIAPDRTATGRPLLANDLHIGPSVPSPWYLCKLTAPGLSVAGVSFPGAPAVLAGHNGTCAWGMTAGMSDVVDLFAEELSADGRRVREGRSYVSCDVVREIIAVRDAEPVVEEVLITPRGPVISPVLTESGTVFSLSAVWLKKLPVTGLFDVHQAASFEDIRRIFEDWTALPLHMVYADKAGNIGWQLTGRVPDRKKGFGTIPQNGWDPEAGWKDELVPAGNMPWKQNPGEGYLVTANNRPFDFDNKPFLAVDWVDGFRAARITELLEKRRDWDNDKVMKLQQDLYVIPWRELRDIVLSLPQRTEQMKLAVTLLSAWDGRASADSPAATVYELFMSQMHWWTDFAQAPDSFLSILGEGVDPLLSRTFVPMRRAGHLIRLLREQPEGWFMDSWDDEMVSALTGVINELRRKYGNDPTRWAWGTVRTLTLQHQLAVKKPLDKVFNIGPFPWGGDTHTVAQSYVDPRDTRGNPGAVVSLRYVVDVGNWDNNLFAMAGGQSGNPFSPNYSDMLKLIRDGKGIPIPWSKEKEKAAVKNLLELVPTAS
jgi:penicillin amidase